MIDFSWEPIKPEGPGELEVVEPEVVEPVLEADASEESALPADASSGGGLPEAQLYVWSAQHAAQPTPGRDNYALRLSAGRTLYDNGRTVASTPALRALIPAQTLRVNPSEISRVGVADGESVRVSTARGSLVLSLTGDANVPAGVAVMPFNIGDTGVGDLVDVSLVVTDLRLETLR